MFYCIFKTKFSKKNKGVIELLPHRCTRVENPGDGVPDIFAKIPRGVKAISGFIAFLLTSVLKFA